MLQFERTGLQVLPRLQVLYIRDTVFSLSTQYEEQYVGVTAKTHHWDENKYLDTPWFLRHLTSSFQQICL